MAIFRLSAPAALRRSATAGEAPRDLRAGLAARFAALRASCLERADPGVIVGFALAVSLLGFASMAFVPAESARDHTALETVVEWVFTVAFTAGCAATWLGAVRGRRLAPIAAVPTSALLLFSAVSCPLSGHHTYGTWAIGSIGAAAATLLLSVAALRTVKTQE
ncbi:MAG: hypothetical protein ACM3S1_13800 [Hyphomicrobiales bacterium]